MTTIIWITYAVVAVGSVVPWARAFYNREPGESWAEIGQVPPQHMGWAFLAAAAYSLLWPCLLVFVLGFFLVEGIAWISKLRPVRKVLNKIVGA